MKFLKLEINNINSLESATIDFENLLSNDEHVFLIWGPSGAGKTTILDAISLALFKKVPRLEDIQNKNCKYVDSELQIKESSGGSIATDDIRQCLKRGAKAGFCSLQFIGNDNVTYTAKLSFSINKNNNLDNAKWILESSKGILDNVRRIESKIVEITGLTYDQFCRTILLSQGEFSKFMKSDQKNKAEILEKLTDTGLYSELGRRIYEKFSNKRDELNEKKNQCQNVVQLSDEEIDELNSNTKELEFQLNNYNNQEENLLNIKNWISTNSALSNSVEQYSKDFQKAESEIENPEFAEKETTVKLWEQTEKQRNTILSLNKLLKYKTNLQTKKQNLENKFYNLSKGYNYQIFETEKSENKQKQLESKLKSFESRSEILNNHNLWIEKIKNFDSFKHQNLQIENDITANDAEINANTQKLNELNRQLNENSNAVNNLNIDINRLKSSIENIEYQQLIDNRAGLNKEIADLDNLKENAEKLKRNQEEIKSLRKKIEESNLLYDNEIQNLGNAEKALESANNNFEIAQKSYYAAYNSVNDFAKQMRNILKIGDYCPVCGKQIDALLSNESVEAGVLALKNAMDTTFQIQKSAKTKCDTVNTKISILKGTLSGLDKDLKIKSKDFQESKQKLLEKAQQLKITDISEIYVQISSRKEELNTQIDNLNKNIEIYENTSKQITQIEKNRDKFAKIKEDLVKNVAEVNQNISGLQSANSEKRKIIDQNIGKITELKSEIDGSLIQFYSKWDDNITHTITQIKSEARDFTENKTSFDNLSRQVDNLRAENNQIFTKIDEISKILNWEILEEPVFYNNLFEESNKFVNECKVLQNEIETNNTQIDDYQREISDFLSENAEISREKLEFLSKLQFDTIESLRQEVKAKRDSVSAIKIKLEQIIDNQKEHNLKKPEFPEDSTIEKINQEIEELKAVKESLRKKNWEISERLRQDAENKLKFAQLLNELDKMQAEYNNWERLNSAFGDSKGTVFREIAQSFLLKKLLIHTNYFLERLSDRYELTNQGSNLLIFVKDKYLNGTSRPVESVSGGESFIISIALALGLSKMSVQGISSNFIFIDEGISQLDGERCDNVITMLQQLHKIIDCNIGLISHLDKLSEMIPTKILVTPISLGTSKITIKRG